jgi:hypothetical protein
MKVKKLTIGVLLAIGLVAVFSVNANAADAWYTCTVVRVGGVNQIEPMVVYVMLTDTKANPTFTRMYFRVPDKNTNQVMAILLTALSSNLPVSALVDPTLATSDLRLLKSLYLNYE